MVWVVALLLLSCGQCQGSERPPAPDAGVPRVEQDGGEWEAELQKGWELGFERNLTITTHLWPLAGPVDEANRYVAAVRVLVEFPELEEASGCGGVILNRRWVLTAGHCVCRQHRVSTGSGESLMRIDSSDCAKTAIVKTTFYELREGKSGPGWHGTYQRGTVHPHPEVSITLNGQGRVVSSHADLALISLHPVIDKEFSPMPLSDKEVKPGETLTIVGSGYDELEGAYDGERRASRNQVVEVLPVGGGMMRIEQPGGHHYRQESGGPCVREEASGPVLVGLSSRNLGEGQAIMSTYDYLDWLRGEIRNPR